MYEEMVCDACMESHDFLRAYQLQTTPTTVEKESPNNAPTNEKSPSLEVAGSDESEARNESDSDNCELARLRVKRSVLLSGNDSPGAGFFNKSWRSQLCTCPTCKVHLQKPEERVGP